MSKAALVVLLLVAVWPWTGCSEPVAPAGGRTPLVEPRYWGGALESVDAALKVPSADTIADDTRTTLPPTASVLAGTFGNPSTDRRARVPLWRPWLAQADGLVAAYRTKGEEGWSDQRLALAEAVRSADGSYHAVFDLPDDVRPGAEVLAWLQALPGRAGSEHTSRPVRVPPGAVLEASVGMPRFVGGDVVAAVSVEVCGWFVCDELLRRTVQPDEGWVDLEVPLDAYADDHVRFRFRTRELSGPGRGAAVWANPTVVVPEPATAERPNVLLISLDTLRADRLSVYGHSRDTSPAMARLFGEEGTVFERCLASAGSTLPSHMTMFTSLRPSEHGVYLAESVLDAWIPTLAEVLREAGVATAAFTENGWVGKNYGFDRGFARFVENKSADVDHPEGQIRATFGGAKAWLEANRDRRFFAFVHTFQVHDPYVPPKEYRRSFGDLPPSWGAPHAAQHQLDALNYDREIRFTDDQVADLVAWIDQLGLAENTVVIVTSDHGEEFGEHGHILHGLHLYEEIVHVPLLLRGPGIEAGRRIADTVGVIDVMPTVLDLSGVAVPDHLSGRSLAPYFDGDRPDGAERVRFSEHWSVFALGPRHQIVPYERPSFAVFDGTKKLMRYKIEGQHVYRFHDLADDPRERRALANDGEDFERLRELLDGYHAAATEHRGRLRARLEGDAPAAVATPMDADREQKLRALGYLD